MAYIRWIYKSWNVFWTFIGVLVLTVSVLIGLVFGALQLDPVQNRIADELETQFNQRFEGVLSIGKVDGLLPFNINLKDVVIYPNDSTYTGAVSAGNISAGIDFWSVLQDRLIINKMIVNEPTVFLDQIEGPNFTLSEALRKRNSLDEVEPEDSLAVPLQPTDFQVIIPSFILSNGTIVFKEAADQDEDNFLISDLQMDMFFEFTEEQRFIDFNSVQFKTNEPDLTTVQLNGQVFNDDQFFELNSFNINTEHSSLSFSMEADGINALRGQFMDQLENSQLTLNLNQILVGPPDIRRFYPELPETENYFQGSLQGEGMLSEMVFNNGELIFGESFMNFNGRLRSISEPQDLGYLLELESLIVGESEIQFLTSGLTEQQKEALINTRFEGLFEGDLDSTNTEILAEGSRGSIGLNGTLKYGEELGIDFNLITDSLNIGYLIDPRIHETNLSLYGRLRSTSIDPFTASGGLFIESNEPENAPPSQNDLYALVNWSEGIIEPEFRGNFSGVRTQFNGRINIQNQEPEIYLRGSSGNLPVKELTKIDRMRPVESDIEFEIDITGNDLQNLFGKFTLDILESRTHDDTLGRHQLYLDFNDPAESYRILRFTSTAFDATVEGEFNTESVVDLTKQWSRYLSSQIDQEIFFNEAVVMDSVTAISNQNLEVEGRVKNPGLLNFYVTDLPKITSAARFNSSFNVNSQQLLFTTSISDQNISINRTNADTLELQMTGGFRYGAELKDFSNVQLQSTASRVDLGFIEGRGFAFNAIMNRDSLNLNSSMAKLSDNASFDFEGRARILDQAFELNIDTLNLGTNSYTWQNEGVPTIVYNSNETFELKDFVFENQQQFLQINGTFSNDPADSVRYSIEDLNLDEISALTGKRLTFGGTLNGEFTTRTLTTVPTVQGNMDVEALEFGEQLVGDMILNSNYNSELDRFDTNISVSTDSSKYSQYYENTSRKGQEFDISGYILAPKEGDFPNVDSLYNFDLDIKNIDLWILPIIAPKVFTEGSGLANGSGKLWGNTDTYDFTADFMVGTEDAAYLRPRFLDTYYYAQGGINFTRNDGLTFNDIYLIDPSGGNAILSGDYDFNDFAPIDSMNIRLEMDEFQFLNNTFDPTVAFFGDAYGSGTVTITGTNFDPVLRTEQPLQITDFSEISIPLLEETEFDEGNRFIRFVDSFEEGAQSQSTFNNRNGRSANGQSSEENVDLSFTERFTMDLQFVSNDPMTVRLIFDPVTGDIVTAEGTGRIRILLEDENVSMFGRFDIQGGRYQFVSGDIFTRRFDIESGGSIVWEGDPANARLNLNAIYSARPDINTLSPSGSIDPENSQRVPIELVLNIGGTISSIENNFFFRLPNTFESQQSSTLATQLATINRDEDLKLLQAANFMLMGNFIPVSSSGQAQSNMFGDNLSGSAAVLNPLLSSQVINPLLSSQINSLLNSDLSSLDVDFNLNTYNQVDLGVALRLYNDKLILRREGQITGRQSNIGDLGATYRINRTFAVTAFHRQDLTFGTLNSTEQSQQSQDINGVGLEAKVSFNSWDEFFKRLFSPFRKLFGINDNQEETENSGTESPA
ncbi:hypothetical protein ACKGJO_02905 [Gracilimonas sp. Q87]|uniref:translocation/assembly module TamB domain-containing protein n=1 Tax=Gracilimonas sp. Q87 TaxID=3384766 RepID=UPI0039840930